MAQRKPARDQRIRNALNGRNIVFLGMMGSGKSAIGKMVARRLGFEFRDADAEIEEAAGRSVSDIFAQYGEDEFRRLEQRVIDRVLSDGPLLLALGGGAFMHEDTRKLVEREALSVWLNADLEIILERVSRRPGKRPLLKTGDPREIIAKLMKKRDPVYALADVHVMSHGGTKAEMRDFVLDKIDQYLGTPS